MNREETVFPFAAVVNQEQVKKALLLNAVNHQVGGVLIRGRRGTAKSTLARGLAHLLPEMDTVADCPFSCDPRDIETLCGFCSGRLASEGTLPVARTRMKLVTLPLNATEEMVVGTIDIEKALKHGEKGFEPGILARANRSLLYVDEVNLLEDHIVDILLDSAAMGVNIVEREGISFRHGARFILVGTMNPEEGDLRPQHEDRFGLCADVDTEATAGQRAEILRRNLQFSRNPLEFESQWHQEQEETRRRVLAARERYASVEVEDGVLETVARLVDRAGADGHRADIAMLHSARALAALEGDCFIEDRHILGVAALALNHRLRKGPLGMESASQLDMGMLLREARQGAPALHVASPPGPETPPEADGTGEVKAAPDAPAEKKLHEVGAVEGVTLPEKDLLGNSSGRRGQPQPVEGRGRYYRSAPLAAGKKLHAASDIAIDATIRASAARGGDGEGNLEVIREDIKVKKRKGKCGASVVFVVDASASMGAKKRLEASRQAILSMLVEAYQKRDRVGLVVFKDDAAQIVMSPTSSPALANRLLEGLAPGGTTPLSHGLALGSQVLDKEMTRTPRPSPVLVLISDGCGNVTLGSGNPMSEALEIAREIKARGFRSVVIDSAPVRPEGSGAPLRPTAAKKIADAMGGAYHPVRHLTGESIMEKVSRTCGMQEASAAGR